MKEIINKKGIIKDKKLNTPENRVVVKAYEATEKQIIAENLQAPDALVARLTVARMIAVNAILGHAVGDDDELVELTEAFIDDLYTILESTREMVLDDKAGG